MPFHCDDARTDRWSLETLDELYPMAMDSSNDLVEWMDIVAFKGDQIGPEDSFATDNTDEPNSLPSWVLDKRLEFQQLTSEMLSRQNRQLRLRIPSLKVLQSAGYNHLWLFKAPVVDTIKMLRVSTLNTAPNCTVLQTLLNVFVAQSLLNEVATHRNTVQVDTACKYESLQEMIEDAKKMGCDVLINCTGLGAGRLCKDPQVMGARGVLLQFDRAKTKRTFLGPSGDSNSLTEDAVILVEEPPWGDEDYPCYLIPRGNDLVVGGSYILQHEAESLRPSERKRLMEYASILGIDTESSKPDGEWVGFRPYRATARCEIDWALSDPSLTVVHSYGYGGSGWTVSSGVAKEVANLIRA